MASLSIQSVQKSFGIATALSDVTLEIKSGEFICLLGESGCGKTTLLRQIAGLDMPDSGQILLDGEDLISVPCHKRNIGMVFQSLALFPHLNVLQNVAYALEIQGVDKATRNAQAETLLETVGLKGLGKRRMNHLSGGQRQRVAIARALAAKPALFLMDEPFSALDAGLREHLQIELKKLQQSLGITTIFVTHDQREAMAVADRIVVLNKGRIEQAGTPTQIYSQPNTAFVAEFIGDNNILDLDCAKGVVSFQGEVLGKADLSDGQHKIAIRPEHLKLLPSNSKQPGLKAKVSLVRSLGALFETELELPIDDMALVQTSLTQTDSQLAKVGDDVKVEFDLTKIWVIPK